MGLMNKGLLVIGFFLVPVVISAEEKQNDVRAWGSIEESGGVRDIQTNMSLIQIAQAASTTAGSSETTVSVKSLLEAKVLDSTNREMGTVRGFLVDPQSGKLVRADIALSGGGGLLGKGGEQQLSVPWEQLSVKRQEGSFVLVLNQQAMEKVQSIQSQKQESSGKQEQQREQKSK